MAQQGNKCIYLLFLRECGCGTAKGAWSWAAGEDRLLTFVLICSLYFVHTEHGGSSGARRLYCGEMQAP